MNERLEGPARPRNSVFFESTQPRNPECWPHEQPRVYRGPKFASSRLL